MHSSYRELAANRERVYWSMHTLTTRKIHLNLYNQLWGSVFEEIHTWKACLMHFLKCIKSMFANTESFGYEYVRLTSNIICITPTCILNLFSTVDHRIGTRARWILNWFQSSARYASFPDMICFGMVNQPEITLPSHLWMVCLLRLRHPLTHPVPDFRRLRVALDQPSGHLPVPQKHRLMQQPMPLKT